MQVVVVVVVDGCWRIGAVFDHIVDGFVCMSVFRANSVCYIRPEYRT